ncbi:MAG: L-histidine N(alpha)-methyltransferase [Rhizobiales bacterium]|nr:L-histidine N(alpha)-methyltransferase [Hyphomicrobiales bacterium]
MQDTQTIFASRFLEDVVDGLSARPKTLPCKYFYDELGSDLFEQITKTPEYYPTRTETRLLESLAGDLAALVGPRARLVEYGAGALLKTRILLDAFEAPAAYVPMDVSAAFLQQSASDLSVEYPALEVTPVVGSFLDPDLAIDIPGGPGRALGFFPGSTIGNLDDAEINLFLQKAGEDLGPDGWFLLGVDVNQDPSSLIPAYNDKAGVTAAFNKNILKRIRHELGGSLNLDAFRHEARWNAAQSRMEMHLVSLSDQTISVAGHRFSFREGESIHTENSRKFSLKQIRALARDAGWDVHHLWQSPDDRFAVTLLARDGQMR